LGAGIDWPKLAAASSSIVETAARRAGRLPVVGRGRERDMPGLGERMNPIRRG
jgi:hypothetical protein